MKPAFLQALVLVLALTGCVTYQPLSPDQLKGANYGAYPSDYQNIVKKYYGGVLFDPYSAHYSFPTKPAKSYAYVYGQPQFGYQVRACVNAKNRMGGYVGEQCRQLFIRNNSVLDQAAGISLAE